jgi:lanosterol synthase
MSGPYTQGRLSYTMQTAFPCLALIHPGHSDLKLINRGAHFIMSQQKSNGEWKQEYLVAERLATW